MERLTEDIKIDPKHNLFGFVGQEYLNGDYRVNCWFLQLAYASHAHAHMCCYRSKCLFKTVFNKPEEV